MKTDAVIAEILAVHPREQSALLPILHDVQAEFGCVDAAAERIIADALNLSRAEVHGVVSFYHDFRSAPDPRPAVQICQAESCKARGIDMLMQAARDAAGERVRLAPVYCLGLCSVGPNARVGDRLHARLDEAQLVSLVKAQ
jgi:formate dehydrogenase subunit gamma